MKTSYLFSAMASAMLMFSACSSEDDIIINDGNDLSAATQEIVLQVKSTGTGLTTRAGRPLLSDAAGQQIDNVVLFICDDARNIEKKIEISNWLEESETYDQGRVMSIKLESKDKVSLENGIIYAIGYSKNSAYNVSPFTNLQEGGTIDEALSISLTNGLGEEIFAGETEFAVNKKGGFTATPVLNRQVAGVYGYFESIPYFPNAAKLRLVTHSKLNSNLVFGKFFNQDFGSNGNNKTGLYAVNGYGQDNGTTLYEIELSKWFKEIKDVNNDGVIDKDNWTLDAEGNASLANAAAENANWNTSSDYKDTKVSFKPGSVFAGNFVVPFAKADNGAATLELQLLDSDGKVLLTWDVKLKSGDAQLTNYTFSYIENKAWNVSESYKDDQKCYNILRNHLYAIGKRVVDDPYNPNPDPDPDPNPNPDPDPDDPEDINNKQSLDLRVNDQWEVLHRMELD